ncbi:hypothetical protein CLV80_10114 [Yoonia maritima]|uniref:Uncharacterized protein n=1 Tax=Yoonia maritima TaxID=1435347 RepID=A0A2T0W3X1_9RHOB|nr:hypothetical protein CLV80_10114 [Yoonia maritima]
MRRHIINKIGQMADFAIKNEWVAEAQSAIMFMCDS